MHIPMFMLAHVQRPPPACNPLITLFQNEPRDARVALSEPMLTPFLLIPEMILPNADIAMFRLPATVSSDWTCDGWGYQLDALIDNT